MFNIYIKYLIVSFKSSNELRKSNKILIISNWFILDIKRISIKFKIELEVKF